MPESAGGLLHPPNFPEQSMRYLAVVTLITAAAAGCAQDGPAGPNSDAAFGGPSAHLASHETGEMTAADRAALAQVRRATARFHDVDKAIAAGYTVWSPDPSAAGATCPTSAEGRMGYHLVNVGLRGGAGNPAGGDAEVVLEQPEMLLYEKRADGKLHLVGVEYLVFKAAWEREHGAGAAAPEILGRPLPFSTHAFVPGGPSIAHYELHVWAWEPNPHGMFYPWNPNVTC